MYSPPFTERGDEMNFSLMLQNIDRRQRFDLNFVLRMNFFILLRIIINCLFLNKYIDRRQTTDFKDEDFHVVEDYNILYILLFPCTLSTYFYPFMIYGTSLDEAWMLDFIKLMIRQ